MNYDNHICRAKRIDTGEWVYGYYVKHNTVMTCFSEDDPRPKHYIVNDGSACDWGFEPPLQATEIDPETVCRCVGIKDKNGKFIFENDIVKGKVHVIGGYRVRSGVIKYSIDGFKMKVGQEDKNIPFDCTIIGNVFDNPKLMEANND